MEDWQVAVSEALQGVGDQVADMKSLVKDVKKTQDVEKAMAECKAQGAWTKETAKGFADLGKSLKENKANLQSNDPCAQAIGYLSLGASAFALAGPQGAAVGALFSLTASIWSFCQSSGPSLAKVVNDVVVQALKDYKDSEVTEKALTVISDLGYRMADLADQSVFQLPAKANLSNWLHYAGFVFQALDPLASQIAKLSKSKNAQDADRAAQYVAHYATIGTQAKTYVMQLSMMLGMAGVTGVGQGQLEHFNSKFRTALAVAVEPCQETRLFYGAIHALGDSEVRLVESFMKDVGSPMEGRLVKIRNEEHGQYLGTLVSLDPHVAAFAGLTLVEMFGNGKDRGGVALVPKERAEWFRIFGPDKECRIYHAKSATHVYAATYEQWHDKERSVWRWKPGGPVGQGVWDITGGRIFNRYHEEYMYGSDKSHKGCHQVFTDKSKAGAGAAFHWMMLRTDGSTDPCWFSLTDFFAAANHPGVIAPPMPPALAAVLHGLF